MTRRRNVEKVCGKCGHPYRTRDGHVRGVYHRKEAYDLFIKKHMSPEMCHICNIIIEGSPQDHVKLKHEGPAYDEFKRTLNEEGSW
jgi:hypothetical protein